MAVRGQERLELTTPRARGAGQIADPNTTLGFRSTDA